MTPLHVRQRRVLGATTRRPSGDVLRVRREMKAQKKGGRYGAAAPAVEIGRFQMQGNLILFDLIGGDAARFLQDPVLEAAQLRLLSLVDTGRRSSHRSSLTW
jgi:hypothetical protein